MLKAIQFLLDIGAQCHNDPIVRLLQDAQMFVFDYEFHDWRRALMVSDMPKGATL